MIRSLVGGTAVFSIIFSYAAYFFELLFLIVGIAAILKQKGFLRRFRYEGSYPSISIIVPCFNEEKSIARSIAFLRRIQYPALQIILVNDGSKDQTLEIIRRELALQPTQARGKGVIETANVKGLYRSECNKFLVIDKVNGGKADSLNAGINLAESELITCVDADTLIKEKALLILTAHFLHDPRVVAAGGNVRIKNDSERLREFPRRLAAPRKLLPKLQAIEYIRSINIARNALSLMNANLIISGAFGIFRTSLVKELKGYEKMSKGEDFELVVRIHLHMLRRRTEYRVIQVYFADGLTDGPESYRELASQRKRWQIGFISTLRTHAPKLLRFPAAPVSFITFPYLLMFELLSPLFQLFSYAAIPVLVAFHALPLRLLLYVGAAAAFNALVNIGFLAADFSLSNNYRGSDKMKLALASFLEPFFYHQLNCWWKLRGGVDFLRKVFVKAAWKPPRGQQSMESRYDQKSILAGSLADKGLSIDTDYLSLYQERIVILSLQGSYRSGDIDETQRLVDYFGGKKRVKFILEMKALNVLSADALSFLLKLSRYLKKRGGGMAIVNPNPQIADAIKISNAIKELKCFGNYSDAISELKYI